MSILAEVASEVARRLWRESGLRHEADWQVDEHRARMTRAPHHSEGHGRVALPAHDIVDHNGICTRAFAERLARDIETMARLKARDAELVRMGYCSQVGAPWAFVIHPVGAGILRHLGLDPADCTNRLYSASSPGNQKGWPSTVLQEWAIGYGVNPYLYRGAVVFTSCQVRRADPNDYEISFEDGKTPILSMKVSIPETHRQAIVGMALEDVVDHPAVKGVRSQVVATPEGPGGLLRLQLEADYRPVADAPAKVTLPDPVPALMAAGGHQID